MNNSILAGIIIGVVVLIGGSWYFMHGKSFSEPGVQQEATQTNQEPTVKEFVLQITDKKLAANSTITVKQGDTVTLKITSDEAEEFHIHGYDNSVELEPGKEAVLTYVASASGRFPFELENSKTDLGAIEVLP